ncbi:hypothetical protein FRX31_010301 [Thalictrum thalictroides]|uniref:Uncharacterized protein n=1 Tax=Thalictrum thalictroides TaxID=46969 RepID=A0A7J6WVK9_THATH|nr:hypothetical protein FRX31_010301 [Thalictrum thalictroides]
MKGTCAILLELQLFSTSRDIACTVSISLFNGIFGALIINVASFACFKRDIWLEAGILFILDETRSWENVSVKHCNALGEGADD